MVTALTLVHLSVLLLSAGLTAWLGVVGWKNRERPAARPFVGLMAAATVWSLGYAGGVLTPDPGWRVVWEQIQWFGISFVPLLLLLFFAEHTGFETLCRPPVVGALAIVPVVTLGLVWTNSVHQLVWVETRLVFDSGLVVAEQTFGPWYWVNLLYTYLLTGGGVFVLLYSLRGSIAIPTKRVALLGVGIGAPFVANLTSVLGYQPIVGLDMTPYVFPVTAIAFARAVFDHALFERPPSTLSLGRRSALENATEPVLVTDTHGEVVYANPAAKTAFRSRTLRRGAVSALVGDPTAPSSPTEPRRVDGRWYEVLTSPIEDAGGRPVGTTYLLYDVTARERRLETLERHRSELLELAELNRTLRGVSRVLVSAQTKHEVVEGVTNQLQTARWYRTVRIVTDEAVSRSTEREVGSRHRLTVPVAFGETTYGSLVVETERESGFTADERDVLEEMAAEVAMTLNAIETRETLLSDERVALTFEAGTDGSPLATATARHDVTITVTATVPVDASALLVYADVELEPDADTETDVDVIVESAVSTLADAPGVTNAELVPDQQTVSLRVDGTTPMTVVTGRGANLVSVIAVDGKTTLVVETASGSSVRALTEALSAVDDNITLVSKRRHEPRSVAENGGSSGRGGDTGLTPRQRDAINAAAESGYFNWPRDSTAEDVADSMGIAPSTFHSHLRKAESKLVDRHLDRRERG
jgi:predicted DNA binding protein/PAS domain-containing protein